MVVQFDGADAYLQLEQRRETTRAEVAKTERDLARLEKEHLQSGYAVTQSRLELELAILKADVPEGLIGSLEYAEIQLEREKAITALKDAQARLADKTQSLAERRRQAELDEKKGRLVETWWQEMLDSFAVRAQQDGYVIHASHPWTGSKYQEGDTVQTSFKVAQIADTSDLAIRVWINSVDRPHIEAGQAVRIILDALPSVALSGRL